MPSLPTAVSFTGAGVTEAQFKTAITDQREFIASLLGTTGTQADALTALGALLNGVTGKSAAYTVVAADRGKLIDYTSAGFDLTLPAVSVGAGFALAVKNSAASGAVTLKAAATIDGVAGATGIPLSAGESCLIVCEGAIWKTLGRSIPIAGLLFLAAYNSSTPGAWSTTVPANAKSARITVTGGNGGSGGVNGAYPGYSSGSGGAGGSSVEIFAVTPGATLSGTVGSGGTAGATGGGNGGSGSATTCTQSGQTANGGAFGYGQISNANGAAGVGGTATGGDTNTTGATGGAANAVYNTGANAPGIAGVAGSVAIVYTT